MEVCTKEGLLPWFTLVEQLKRDIDELRGNLPEWVNLEEAMRLTGRSRSWFYLKRDEGKLPIAMLPSDEGSRRTMYRRADCVAYGIDHAILPPTAR